MCIEAHAHYARLEIFSFGTAVPNPSPCKGEGGAEGAGWGSRLSADSELVAGPPPDPLRGSTSPLQGEVSLRARRFCHVPSNAIPLAQPVDQA
jgi:hypothetical protein